MSEPTTRRQREHQQHLKHILDVAESIFTEKGFLRTKMRQIAQKAEFALGTVYSYFGSKRQLYKKVVETKLNELVDFVTGRMAGTTSIQGKVKEFVKAKMVFFNENLPFLRLYLVEIDIPQPEIDHDLPKKVRERYDSMLCDLTGVIQAGIRKGFFRSLDAKGIAKVLDRLTNAFALSWLDSKEMRPSVETDIHNVTELFLHGIVFHQEPTQN